MDIAKAKRELRLIVRQIKADAKEWKNCMQQGREVLHGIAKTQMRIFGIEDRLSSASKTRKLRSTEKSLRQHNQGLGRPFSLMKAHLGRLGSVVANTERMLSRVRLWHEDELIASFQIAKDLRTAQLLATLEFLAQRYGAEYEVKEMVVLEMEWMDNAHDVLILMEAWRQCPHANSQEIFLRLKMFTK